MKGYSFQGLVNLLTGDYADAIIQRVYDGLFPIGTYWTTEVESENPATRFGGTWTRLSSGQHVVATTDAEGGYITGGETTPAVLAAHTHSVSAHEHSIAAHAHLMESHSHGEGTLTTQNVLGHSHTTPDHAHTMSHTHTRGSMEIDGGFVPTRGSEYNENLPIKDYSGAFAANQQGYAVRFDTIGMPTVSTVGVDFLASRSWDGNTSEPSTPITGATSFNTSSAGGHAHAVSGETASNTASDTGYAGGGTTSGAGGGATGSEGDESAVIPIQPLARKVYMWRRTG